MTTSRKLVAEGLGTLLLVAAVVGSGIMAQRLARDPAIALLCNTIATGGALVAILLMFGPSSGAQLNPVVTIVMALARDLTPRLAVGYVTVQVVGAIVGAALANAMFARDTIEAATTARHGFSILLSESVATFGLVGVVICVGRSRPTITPFAVAAYIVAAYWFTASTSFANPAVTIARAFSNSYAGIRIGDVAAFVIAQSVGGALAAATFLWLVPLRRPVGAP